MSAAHNHVTRDIKPAGECPSCDEYWYSEAQRQRTGTDAVRLSYADEGPEDAQDD